jgi:glycine cleavage system transcriptional repressor
MNSYFAISAIGNDRPGIVADLSELVYACGCNLEDSSSTLLENQFAHLMIVSSPDPQAESRLSTGCKRLEWERKLTVFFTPLKDVAWRKVRGEGTAWELKALGVDKAGIVCKVTRLLADHGMNIERMETSTYPSADTGTPVFRMRVLLWGAGEPDTERLRRELEDLGNQLVVDITLDPVPDKTLAEDRECCSQ